MSLSVSMPGHALRGRHTRPAESCTQSCTLWVPNMSWQQHAEIFRDSHDAMRSVMWHKDQKSVCALVLAIVNEAKTL